MQEMNLIPRSTTDYPATGTSAMISTQAPGLQNSRDIAPIVAAKNGNAFPLHCAAEHNPPVADEKVETLVVNLVANQTAKEKKWQKVTSLCGYLLVIAQCKMPTRKWHIWFFPTHKPMLEKPKEPFFANAQTDKQN
jgi:hypothetical protein